MLKNRGVFERYSGSRSIWFMLICNHVGHSGMVLLVVWELSMQCFEAMSPLAHSAQEKVNHWVVDVREPVGFCSERCQFSDIKDRKIKILDAVCPLVLIRGCCTVSNLEVKNKQLQLGKVSSGRDTKSDKMMTLFKNSVLWDHVNERSLRCTVSGIGEAWLLVWVVGMW